MFKIIDNYLLKTYREYHEKDSLRRLFKMFIFFSIPQVLIFSFLFFFPLVFISFVEAVNFWKGGNLVQALISALFPAYFSVNVIIDFKKLFFPSRIFRVKEQRNLLIKIIFDMLISAFYVMSSQSGNVYNLLSIIGQFKNFAVAGIYNELNFMIFFRNYEGKLSKSESV